MHSYGNRIFNYSNPQVGVEDPARFRLNYGFKLWAAGFDGALPYAYQHSMGFIWNDFDHKIYRDLALVYPTANGVVRTLAWYGFREAIDDARYISLVEEMSNSTDVDARPASRLLDQLRSHRIEDAAESRRAIIEFIHDTQSIQ